MSDPVINKHLEKMVRKDNKSKKSQPIPEGALRLLKNHCPCQQPPPSPPVVEDEVEASVEEPLLDIVNPPLNIGVGVDEDEDEPEEALFIADEN